MQQQPGSKKPKFSRELIQSSTQPVVKPPCQLKLRMNCCGGSGYVIEKKGAHTGARVCECVKTCQACFGRARLTEGNDSKPCRNPSPTFIANSISNAMIPARYSHATLDRFPTFRETVAR